MLQKPSGFTEQFPPFTECNHQIFIVLSQIKALLSPQLRQIKVSLCLRILGIYLCCLTIVEADHSNMMVDLKAAPSGVFDCVGVERHEEDESVLVHHAPRSLPI